MANWPGKVATAVQFATVASALFRARFTETLLVVAAISGSVAAVVYWQREVARSRKRTRPE
jgi:hypothetical protein